MAPYTAEYHSFIGRPGEAAGRRIEPEKYVSLLYFKLRAVLFLRSIVWPILHSTTVYLGDSVVQV